MTTTTTGPPTYFFGDSHALFTFRGAPNARHLHQFSVTMHRVGRDGRVVNRDAVCDADMPRDAVAVVLYGEVDCRCHVGKQVALGRDAVSVCDDLVAAYLRALASELRGFARVVLPELTPPTRRAEQEAVHGPILHEFPFVGTDAQRVAYTALVNARLRAGAAAAGYTFLEWAAPYRNDDGTLDFAQSDTCGHVKDTAHALAALAAALQRD